jgi:hypothetical protein
LSARFQAGAAFSSFVRRNKASLDGVNEYRLEAYATLPFGASSDASSAPESIFSDPTRDEATA